MDVEGIFRNFVTGTDHVTGFSKYGNGHIHETYKVATDSSEDFIVQRINTNVFKNVHELQRNIVTVIEHCQAKGANEKYPLMLYHMKDGKYAFKDSKGHYWRCFNFISDSRSYDTIPNEKIAVEGGKAYGQFLKLISDIPPKRVKEILPDFHNLGYRFAKLEESISNRKMEHNHHITDEISFAKDRFQRMKEKSFLNNSSKIPLRIVHNDTKINNVLFDHDDKVICVIDLDTVMPGMIHYDYGDAIRTGAASASEDEKDLNKVGLDLDLFRAYTSGFLEMTGSFLTKDEIGELYLAPQLMTYTIGIRFLTDFLDGNRYFKTAYPEHNLVRWKVQRKLLESMEQNENEMKNMIKDIIQWKQ